jgi:DNA-3-methyladenine glycosylase II
MTIIRLDISRLSEGVERLSGCDEHLAHAVRTCGIPPLRNVEPGFPALLRSIVGQQVSIRAAASIWQKLLQSTDPLSPETFLAAGDEALRAAGLSGQKIRYGQALAAAVLDGTLNLAAIPEMSDEEAIAELIKAKGIGRWTAEIYLMFALGRADILPSSDLGLIVAAQALKGLADRPTPPQLAEMALAWRPWRSVASLILWHYRHAMPEFGKAGKG